MFNPLAYLGETVQFFIMGVLVVILFNLVKNWILKRTIQTTIDRISGKPSTPTQPTTQTNSTIGNIYTKDGKEVFQGKKFAKGFFSFDAVAWAKDFVGIFNMRKIMIYLLIAGLIMGYGYWRGRIERPVVINFGKLQKSEWTLQVPAHSKALYHPENSSNLFWVDKYGNKIAVDYSDVPELRKMLNPYGVMFEPIAVVGVGVGEGGSGVEGGIGANLVRYYRWRLCAFATQKGLYGGITYQLDGLNMQNSAVGVAYGKGYKGDDRVMFIFTLRF